MTSSEVPQRPLVVIEPGSRRQLLDLKALWAYRDLLWTLAERDIRLRYKQTLLGVVWVVLQPLMAAIIFSVVFGRLANLPSDEHPYILFVFAGLVAWNLFAGVVQRASTSLISNASLITKVYFPRLILPMASAGSVLVDALVALSAFLVLMLFSQFPVTWKWVTLPCFAVLALMVAMGASLWIGALSVRYRDLAYVLPFSLQVLLYSSPVTYAARLIPEQWRLLYSLNPLVGVIEGFRWALLGSSALTFEMLMVTLASSTVVFLSGIVLFQSVERGFADVV